MNKSTPPTPLDFLRKTSTGRLCVQLDIARTVFMRASTPFGRAKALDEIDAIRNELRARGEKVT